MTTFLIIHGLDNERPAGHWQHILADELQTAGHNVFYPQLPRPSAPQLSEWLAVIAKQFVEMSALEGGETVVIEHSLGAITWLQIALNNQNTLQISRLLLVAPAAPELLTAAATFQLDVSNPVVASKLRGSADHITLLASEEDEWIPRGVAATFGEPLGIEPTIFVGAAHLSMSDGFGRWQGVIDWALEPTSNLCVH